jgi:hypothetical protein
MNNEIRAEAPRELSQRELEELLMSDEEPTARQSFATRLVSVAAHAGPTERQRFAVIEFNVATRTG